ncbi:DUF2550 domain-containing protein [Phycicoccus endophyticus]|uniref:DUF2550 domain-containing protein n=1 Tax=Phycicoccus endophyticus TaxID=1690220 RepID=A0A7G9QYJ9_9MICO|nr:DUF2550 family protein [Phycicoccus endophyticus]NHI19328.1 DUF2550 family protein [Phycicoccus endophyticus]QNN48424.1 DUF2550 domain-containing protein [Phycicoccus endophyticus]GGL41893.1 hypothetical protein GCM10012283_25630 [Phycicoccus endophyticus]
MSAVNASELVLVLLVVLVVGALTFVWARRRIISGDGRPVMLCARRDEPEARWRLGLARLGADRFEWFSIVGPSVRPEVSWLRGQVELGSPRPTPDVIPGLAEPVAVSGRAGGRTCEFAFVPAAYTAVRAWLESSPPGYNVNVA